MVAVTDQQVEAFRAVLSGDWDTGQRQARQLLEAGAANGLGELLYAAFVLAVRRRFSPTWSRAEIVHYVAQVRTTLSERRDMLEQLDPRTAENLIQRALGDDADDDAGMERMAWAQFTLLIALAADLQLTGDALDEFLESVQALIPHWWPT